MQRIEKAAYAQGFSDSEFMENAGAAIAEATIDFVQRSDLPKDVTLLVGKGNNGGDAYAAGIKLLQDGFCVRAIPIFPLGSCSTLNHQQHDKFRKAGGKITENLSLENHLLILDGLVGTGFQGKAEGVLAQAIDEANKSNLPILSIDIPSGLDGTTGEVGSVAIEATETIYLGLPKIGFFIGQGWDHIGRLVDVEFGLPFRFIEEAKAEGYLLQDEGLKLPKMKRSRNKYEAGYVLGVGGSEGMPGAGLLACLAALRSGAGIVRLFHAAGTEMGNFPLEVIKEPLDLKRILEECERASSLFIGPGCGRTRDVKKFLSALLPQISLPCVLDADALYFLPDCDFPKKCVLTPHRGEMKRLLKATPNLANCQAYAEENNATVVLKGGPSFVFHPDTEPLVITRGDPGMATAGTGDVLSGVIAALLAHKLDLRSAASIGAHLHGIAGEYAALEKTSDSMIASDVIECLPIAFATLS